LWQKLIYGSSNLAFLLSFYLLNTSLKERLEGQEGEEGDVSRYWITLRKQEDTRNWRKLRIALFGELSLEEVMDLSQDRLLLNLT
jgi:hypothetical protein